MADDDVREATHEDEAGEAGETADVAAASTAPVPPDDEVAAAVVTRFPAAVFTRSHGQPVVYVERSDWLDLARFLRDDQQFTSCMDVTVVDQLLRADRAMPGGVTAERYEVVANYLSHPRNRRVRAISEVAAGDPEIASIVEVYPGIEFAEREAYDLFGVRFANHPDLTRILMPDDWEGHPLRKDYPPARVPVQFKEAPRPQ
jgi:NADH:ubiquinone oxidoreductase subunit C